MYDTFVQMDFMTKRGNFMVKWSDDNILKWQNCKCLMKPCVIDKTYVSSTTRIGPVVGWNKKTNKFAIQNLNCLSILQTAENDCLLLAV